MIKRMTAAQAKKKVFDLVAEQPLAVLATADKNGVPHASTMGVMLDKDMNMYFVTHGHTRKAKHLMENKQVSGALWKMGVGYIQFSGKVSLIRKKAEAEAQVDKIVEVLCSIEDFWPPLFDSSSKDYVVFRVKINWLRLLDLAKDRAVHEKGKSTYQILGK